MKFFSSISSQKPISVADAVKNAQAKPKARTFDEMVGDIKTIKTASATAKVVTASNNVSVKVKIAGFKQTVAFKAGDKNPEDPTKLLTEQEANELNMDMPTSDQLEGVGVPLKTSSNEDKTVVAKKEDPYAADTRFDKKTKPKGEKMNPLSKEEEEEAEEEEKKEASTTQKLKMAAKLDFRNWSKEKVSAVWKEAGSIQNCMASVKDLTNDPQTYCGLLKVASETANKLIKTAAAETTVKKEASQNTPGFKKLSKLEGKERKRIYDYFESIYGPGYAKAMLGE
jgi:hypothetical protein